MRTKLLKIFMLCVLAFGSLIGIPFNPKDVEEMLAGMNQAKESTLEERDDNGDPDTTSGRRALENVTTQGEQADDNDRAVLH